MYADLQGYTQDSLGLGAHNRENGHQVSREDMPCLP